MAVLNEINNLAVANESDSRKPISLRHVDVDIIYKFNNDTEASIFLDVHPDRVYELRTNRIFHINGYAVAYN